MKDERQWLKEIIRFLRSKKYSIEFQWPLCDKYGWPLNGRCFFSKKIILINPFESLMETIIHESLHALLHEERFKSQKEDLGVIENIEKEIEEEEIQVEILTERIGANLSVEQKEEILSLGLLKGNQIFKQLRGKSSPREKKFPKGYGPHHINPTSRGGGDEESNILIKENNIHRAWHTLFYNLLPDEAIVLINYWADERGRLKKEILGRKNVRAWDTVFASALPQEAIEIVKKEWMKN